MLDLEGVKLVRIKLSHGNNVNVSGIVCSARNDPYPRPIPPCLATLKTTTSGSILLPCGPRLEMLGSQLNTERTGTLLSWVHECRMCGDLVRQ